MSRAHRSRSSFLHFQRVLEYSLSLGVLLPGSVLTSGTYVAAGVEVAEA